jgi:uncharacterized protein YecE (DUF72 family)
MGKVRFGPAGWNYRDWKGVFYPARAPRGFSELKYLAEYFDTAEINTSFYGPFSAKNAAKWVNETKANGRFVFTAKLWERFTHQSGGDATDEKLVREGFDVLQNAGKLGAVLLQFPFSFHNTSDNVKKLKGIIEKFRSYPLVVEVRHASWDRPQTYEFLKENGVGFCNIDQPIIGRSLKPTANVTSDTGYIRFHGRNEKDWFSDLPPKHSPNRYDYKYSIDELGPWIDRIAQIANDTDSLFVIANNHPFAKCLQVGQILAAMYLQRKMKAPESLVETYPELAQFTEPPTQTKLL